VSKGTVIKVPGRKNTSCPDGETFAELRIGSECGRQNLDGDRTVEARVAGLVDLAHSARTEGRDDFVRAEAGAGGQGHESRLIVVGQTQTVKGKEHGAPGPAVAATAVVLRALR